MRTVRAGQRTDDPTGPLTPGQVAGYLAKYATKDAGHLTDPDARAAARDRDAAGLPRPGGPGLRGRRHRLAVRLLGKWVHMLGFRGHFSTKSRRYSITLGALRRARARWQTLAAQSGAPACRSTWRTSRRGCWPTSEEETTLVVGQWTYVGTRLADRRRPGAGAGRRCPGPRVRPSTSARNAEQKTRGHGKAGEVMEAKAVPEDRLWTVADAAYYLGIPVQTL